MRRSKNRHDENQNSHGIESENQNDEESGVVASLEIQDASDDNDLMQFFKNCLVNQNQAELREKLRNSVEYRRDILKNPKIPIYKQFPFYFVDPSLVIVILNRIILYDVSQYSVDGMDFMFFSFRFFMISSSCSVILTPTL